MKLYLIYFDSGNGKISRFLSKDDLESVCGQLAGSNTPASSSYFANCMNNLSTNGTDNGKNWFIFKNSRFQSANLGRAGIWLETDGTYYYRIQTSSLAVNRFDNGNASENIARPVIEISMGALEGLLGVSEEDRLRDYELTYFYGLTNRTRFHDYLHGSSINPMYKSYPTNQDIYNYYTYESYVPSQGEMTDDELLTAFRNAMIVKNT